MNLAKSSIIILNQIIDLIQQLDSITYSANLELLSNNSIGKHIRHIIEFYDCLLKGENMGNINYDARSRNPLLETDKAYTIQFIKECIAELENGNFGNQSYSLHFSLSPDKFTTISTTFERELAYNIEHAIHHMAIIKIAVKQYCPEVLLPAHFGVAYATVKHEQQSINGHS
jgi:hypothetical protein